MITYAEEMFGVEPLLIDSTYCYNKLAKRGPVKALP